MALNGKGQTGREKDIRVKFINRCWKYLDDNFHKLSKPNQLKVCLELCKKSHPQEITGELYTITQMPAITINGEELDIKIG